MSVYMYGCLHKYMCIFTVQKSSVFNKKRFDSSFGPFISVGDDEDLADVDLSNFPTASAGAEEKPKDWHRAFTGNVDDCFKVCINIVHTTASYLRTCVCDRRLFQGTASRHRVYICM